MNGREEREAVMRSELADLGLELRSDSRLCEFYVDHGFGNPKEIAATMEEMEWFFRNTGYARAKRIVRREHEPFVLDQFETSEMAKKRALRWLVRSGEESVLSTAPPSLHKMIEEARRVVFRHPV
jgi:hypothetical protein